MSRMNRADRIEAFRTGAETVRLAWEAVPEAARRHRPAPHEWSPHEIVLHLADADVNGYLRFRKLVAEPGALVAGYAQDDWVRELDYHAQDPDLAIELLRAIRATTYPILADLPENVWSHTVTHSERGNWTMDDWLTTYSNHVRDHLAQLDEAVEAWRASEG
jgi:hypothetical protein